MKKSIFIVFLILSFTTPSQQIFSKELSIISDNDLYVSFKKDRYYTNGIFLNYSYLSKSTDIKLVKKIIGWQLSHEMFSPYKPIAPLKKEHDRPFAGHLFGGFSVKNVFKDHKISEFLLEIGVIGPAAHGQEIQEFIHRTFNFKQSEGWEYQIQNTLSLSLNASFIKQLFMNKTHFFDLNWGNNVQLGTTYTAVNSGVNIRLGLLPLQNIMNSVAYKTQLNASHTNYYNEPESFIYIRPLLSYSLYNATIQGGFFNNKSKITSEIIPLTFNLEIEMKLTLKKNNWGYSFNYNTSKSKKLRYVNGNKFGKITFNYSWN
ncbi:lipid A deacylase LpxR family protein [Polaribacter sp.]|uniref:lipid A deacylase LpxR family protein n=1 Tax=Polaribacter sp. TaxID=1920175 RepID=UPI0025D8C2C0|nr:lipid A deacylase LpxR family protein [Polaribacter sp.]